MAAILKRWPPFLLCSVLQELSTQKLFRGVSQTRWYPTTFYSIPWQVDQKMWCWLPGYYQSMRYADSHVSFSVDLLTQFIQPLIGPRIAFHYPASMKRELESKSMFKIKLFFVITYVTISNNYGFTDIVNGTIIKWHNNCTKECDPQRLFIFT